MRVGPFCERGRAAELPKGPTEIARIEPLSQTRYSIELVLQAVYFVLKVLILYCIRMTKKMWTDMS